MKNTLKVLWMTAIVAVAGFSFASCLTFGGGGARDDAPEWMGGMVPAEWPSLDVWEDYGVAGGLQQPSGTTVVVAYSQNYAGVGRIFSVGLESSGRAAFDNLVSQVERKGTWTVYKRESSRQEEAVSFVQGIYSIAIALDIPDNSIMIMVMTDNEE